MKMAVMLWRLARGYRLRPWRSPYLRWRMETYWGLHAELFRLRPSDLIDPMELSRYATR